LKRDCLITELANHYEKFRAEVRQMTAIPTSLVFTTQSASNYQDFTIMLSRVGFAEWSSIADPPWYKDAKGKIRTWTITLTTHYPELAKEEAAKYGLTPTPNP
jgi:hypothetical protein